MSVTVRPRGKRWEYSIIFSWPEGGKFRERRNAPVSSKSGAQRYGEARERALLAAGKASFVSSKEPCPLLMDKTFADHWADVMRDHYRANRKKASTIEFVESVYKTWLEPALGTKRLSEIGTVDVSALKGALAKRSAKTANNVLGTLSRAMRCAVEWGRLSAMPWRKLDLLPVEEADIEWYEVPDYRRLVDGARKVSPEAVAFVLLGGSAGLRIGEIVALRWCDVDLARTQLRVAQREYRGVVDTPKSGKPRRVDLTPELVAALRAIRGLTERVLPVFDQHAAETLMRRIQRLAGLEVTGRVHVLRHTFCSHLAAAGVSPKAIQELAGHQHLSTTMRYMHLSPADRRGAIDTLAASYGRGAIAEQGSKTG